MNRLSKATVGISLFASLFLTGCGSTVSSEPITSPGATASTPVDTHATPPADATGLVAEAWELHPARIDTLPASDEDFFVREGVIEAATTLNFLAGMEEFYEPRTTANDWEILVDKHQIRHQITAITPEGTFKTAPVKESFTSRLTTGFSEAVQENIKNKGKFGLIPAVDSSGSFGTFDGVDYNPMGVPSSEWNITAIRPYPTVSSSGQPMYVAWIEGERDITFVTESGVAVRMMTTFTMGVQKTAGGGDWLVNHIDWNLTEAAPIHVTPVCSIGIPHPSCANSTPHSRPAEIRSE